MANKSLKKIKYLFKKSNSNLSNSEISAVTSSLKIAEKNREKMDRPAIDYHNHHTHTHTFKSRYKQK